jgi:hypothetical protein
MLKIRVWVALSLEQLANDWTFQGSNSGGGKVYRTRPGPGVGGRMHAQSPIKWVLCLLPGGKRPVLGFSYLPPSSVEVIERV